MADQLIAAPEPVIPIWFDVTAVLVLILYAAVVVAAAITLARAQKLSATHRAVWVIVLIVVPLIGGIVWLGIYAATRVIRRGALQSEGSDGS